ncbi:MAG: cadherin domain-containing protein, partial [Gemmatimonadetes bacterium]|nr:cadherin domain-containing protein [Candidatus Palauibacter australiensis]
MTVTAEDEHGASVSHEFLVTVPNQAPERLGTIPDRTIGRGDTASVAVSGHFGDLEGDTLTYTAVSSDGGVLAVGMTGDRARFEGLKKGTARVTVTADDGHGGRTDQEFGVTVEGENGPPEVASAIPALTVAPGETEVVDASPHFRDPDDDALTYEAVSSNEAAATVNVSGSEVAVTGVSRGEARVKVMARDPEGASVSQAFAVTVPNGAPVAVGTLGPVSVDHGGTEYVEVSSAFSDPENDDLTYRAESSAEDVVGVSVRGSQVAVFGLKRGGATVTVTAEDGHGGTAEQPFEVTVRNAAPRFGRPAYTRSVAENSDAGTAVGGPVTALDTGGDALTYSFSEGGAGLFEIVAASGQIRVAEGAALDYERGDTLHAVRVIASDGTLADTAEVTIRVTDVPAPGKPAAPTVTGGTEEVEVSWSAPANEGPEITNYDLRYRATADGDWTAPAALGAVLADKIEGLEPGTAYQVQVRAESSEGVGEWSDPGEGTTEPDNRAPSFDAETYEREVPENSAPGTAVGAPVTATDEDQDDLTYTLVTGGDEVPFVIDGTTGQIKVAEGAAPDYESGKTAYEVSVQASDGPLAATAAVTIRVTDVPAPGKPDAPEVTEGTEEVEVSWSAPANDGPEITGYDLRYRVKPDGEWKDAPVVGVVLSHTIKGLEGETTYEVQVRAISSEGAGEWSEPGEGTAKTAPKAPVFDAESYEREVPENSAPGTAVGEPVTATDENGDDLTYSLVTGEDEVPFEIDGTTGRITVAEDAALNYESADTVYVVSVEASDGELAATVPVTIRVTNADEPGKVVLSPEVARVGVEMTVALVDEDGVRSATRRRKWQRSRNGNSWNDIATGRMYNPVTSDAGKWLRVVFTYSDRHGPGKRAVSEAVRVLPANAAPDFGADAFEREVPENSPAGTKVGERVAATDEDGDELTYTFLTGDDAFEINGTTGRIKVAEDAALNYESTDTLFTVLVEASDGELADTASVTIRVTDADDPGTVALSPEVARVGVELTATLTDEDGVRDAGMRRRWQRSRNGNSWNDIGTGRMYNPVTGDAGKWLRAVFTYTDGHGRGKRAVSAAVKVLPANTKPSFAAVYEREVPENSPGGTNVGAPVTATDSDSPSLSYSFAEGYDEALFGIVEGTGQITVGAGAALDYESGDTLYTVSVEASDGELADTASVKIRVTNADDPGKIALS